MRPVVAALAGFIAFLLVGNLAILSASFLAKGTIEGGTSVDVEGISKLSAVDPHVWRGAAPSAEGYRNLAEAGVATVVDLRAEEGLEGDAALVRHLGMRLVRIPVRDGQVPSAEEVGRFLAAARDSEGPVFVHCGAGVGRTGTMVGAYLVEKGEVAGPGAVLHNLSVGPPSLEQLAFVVRLEKGEFDRPGPLLTAVSRVLDAPRRIWSRIG